MDFHFQAKRAGGGQVSSRISARDYAEARSMLESRGFRDIELTKVDSLSGENRGSSSASEFPVLRVGLVLIFLVLAVGGIAASIDGSRKEEQGEDEEQLAATQTEPHAIRSTPPPTPVPQVTFAPHKLRANLEQALTSETISTPFEVLGNRDVAFADITRISILRSDEVGYDYVVRVEWHEQTRANAILGTRNDSALEVYLTEDYGTTPRRIMQSGGAFHNRQKLIDIILRTIEGMRRRR
ncbi:hypothetical protein OT109_09315 [Phycisphaeraceae bacterium D3-23]